jgi:hypothetical protein
MISNEQFISLREAIHNEEFGIDCSRPVVVDGEETNDGFWKIIDGRLLLTEKGKEIDVNVRNLLGSIHVTNCSISFIKSKHSGSPEADKFINEKLVYIEQCKKEIREILPENTTFYYLNQI